HLDAKCLRGFEIDYKFVLDGGLNWKLAWFRSPQNAIDIGCGKPKQIALLTSIRQQTANVRKEPPRIDGRHMVTGSQRYNFHTMDVEKSVRDHDQAAVRRAALFGDHQFEIGYTMNRGITGFQPERRSRGLEWVQINVGIRRRCWIE